MRSALAILIKTLCKFSAQKQVCTLKHKTCGFSEGLKKKYTPIFPVPVLTDDFERDRRLPVGPCVVVGASDVTVADQRAYDHHERVPERADRPDQLVRVSLPSRLQPLVIRADPRAAQRLSDQTIF